MKYYYNGKLIRTSKNEGYKYAVIDMANGKCEGCRSEYKAAAAIVSGKIKDVEQGIQNARNAIVSISRGMDRYPVRDGRRAYYTRVTMTRGEYEERYNELVQKLEYVRRYWHIVELEGKE